MAAAVTGGVDEGKCHFSHFDNFHWWCPWGRLWLGGLLCRAGVRSPVDCGSDFVEEQLFFDAGDLEVVV